MKRVYEIDEIFIDEVHQQEPDEGMPEHMFGNEPYAIQDLISCEFDQYLNPKDFHIKLILN